MSAPEELFLARVVRAPRGRVWEVWSDGERFGRWIAPSEDTRVRAGPFDARAGGEWALELAEPDGTTWRGSGRFLVVEAPERLILTWSWEHQGGESVVAVDLRDVEEGTEVVLTHARFASEDDREQAQAGWNEALDKLAAAARAPARVAGGATRARPKR